ncbi:MAG: glutathione peroxidase [Weeksellaceae bacterium]
MASFYDLKASTPSGEDIDFSNFTGKVVLIVNTATKCGLAPQFAGLEELHTKYRDQGLVVIGFPSNQFASQEPVSNEEMTQVCELNHGVTFQLTEKIDVNGNKTHPVFKFLKDELGGFLINSIKWNFTKFLIDKNGKPYKRYAPYTKPEALEKDIIKLLSE